MNIAVLTYLERAEADRWRKQTAVYQMEEVAELRERLSRYEPDSVQQPTLTPLTSSATIRNT